MKTSLPPNSNFILPFVLHNIKGNTEREWVKGTRKPSARKPDEFDERPRCRRCLGDGEIADGTEVCSCGGKGYVEEQDSVVILCWRGFRSIEAIVYIDNGKAGEAYVTTDEGEYKSGQSISLSLEEQAEAERAFEEKEPQSGNTR